MVRVSQISAPLMCHLWNVIITVNMYFCTEQCYGLTYEDVKAAGSGIKFSPVELLTLKREDLEQGLIYLGKDPLSMEQASSIWKALVKQAYGDMSEIPDKCLQQLGWVASGIPPEDISNITLTEIDTIAALGQFHNLSMKQLTALAEQVHNSWAAKEPEDYTCYDLVALQHILCGFNHTTIKMIHPTAYSKASKTLGGLTYCPMEVLQGLATLATDTAAFGNTDLWTPAQVNAIGCVIGGLDASSIASIPAKSLEYLTPDAARCIPPELIKAMSAAQREKLPSAATNYFSREQWAALGSYIHPTHCNTSSSDPDCNSSQSPSWSSEVLITTTIVIAVVKKFYDYDIQNV